MVHLHSTPALTNTTVNTARPNTLGVATQSQATPSFTQELKDAGFSSFQNLFGGSNNSPASTTTTSSLRSTSALPNVSVGPHVIPTPAQTVTTTPAAKPAIDVSNDPVSMLKNAMVAEGLDPSQVTMTYQEQTVQYPGGSYPLHQVKVDFGNGRTTFIDADAMKVNPEIAALDIKWIQQDPFLSPHHA